MDHTGEIEGKVPQAADGQFKALWREVREQRGMLERLLKAVTKDPLVADSPPGLVQVQEAHGDRLDQHDEEIAALKARNEKHGDRWTNLLLDFIKTVGGGIVGAYLQSKGGSH